MSRKEELRDQTVWRSDPHTLVKHLVYGHYLNCWMPKILQKFPNATIVDGFAGPGVYSDGPPGSPILVAKTFLGHAAHARFGNLHILCLDQRPDRAARLRQEIAALGDTPKLTMTVLEPGEFISRQPDLKARAHRGTGNTPTLWLLDPFNIKSLPFAQVADCLSNRYDEAIITFFTDEMHRFCTLDGFGKTLDVHFGNARWREATSISSEGLRKEALVTQYRRSLEALGLFTEQFGVRVRNDSPRYSLVFATHSEYGLKCWNPLKWKLDGYSGSGASVGTINQPDLFGTSLNNLEQDLAANTGTQRTWTQLVTAATRSGYLDKHLREALDNLARQGLAIRVAPVDARSAWPEDSVIQFYSPKDVDTDIRQALGHPNLTQVVNLRRRRVPASRRRSDPPASARPPSASDRPTA